MIAFAAGARALRFALETQLLAHTEKIGALALGLLKDVEKDSSIIGEARGKGLMLGVEFVHDKTTKKPAPELAKRM